MLKYTIKTITLFVLLAVIGFVCSFNPLHCYDSKADMDATDINSTINVNSNKSDHLLPSVEANEQSRFFQNSSSKDQEDATTETSERQNFYNGSSAPVKQTNLYALSVDFGSDRKYFQIELEKGSYSVFDVMQELSKSTEFSFGYKTYSIGIFIKEIMRVKNDPASNRYWFYSVNDKFADKGVDKMQLKDRDKISWVFKSAL